MAESFLYHGVLLMLFDHSFDPFLNMQSTILSLGRYFPENYPETEYSIGSNYAYHPVLGASYRFFLTISEITRLARSRSAVNTRGSPQWQALDLDLRKWESADSHDLGSSNPGTSLYTIAARALLAKAIPVDQSIVDDFLELCLRRGLAALKSISIDSVFSNYYLWPLTILGSIATELEDQALFQHVFLEMARKRRGGLISWAQVRLQRIWNIIHSARGLVLSPKLEGLRVLVEEDSLDCTTVSE